MALRTTTTHATALSPAQSYGDDTAQGSSGGYRH